MIPSRPAVERLDVVLLGEGRLRIRGTAHGSALSLALNEWLKGRAEVVRVEH